MKYRHHLLVPTAIVDSANQAAHQIGIDPEGLLTTLSIPLVPADGPDDAEPTHYGASGCMTESQRLYLEANQAAFPGAMWWRVNDAGLNRNILVASYNSQNLGELWNWDKSLEIAGLKRRIIAIV